MGVLLTSAISTISNVYVFLALSLALSLAASASLLLFVRQDPKKLPIQAKPEVLRLLKGESGTVELKASRSVSKWFSISSATAPRSSGVSIKPVRADDGASFALVANYAGRYDGLELKATFVDVLGLFERRESVKPAKFVVEVLPRSLVAPPARPNLTAIASGEVPAGARGFGQEFYGVEGYTGSEESRDILWKRVAKMPDLTILARIREANVPQSVRVTLLEGHPGDRAVWMDAASEALGKIGVTLLGLRIALQASVAAAAWEAVFQAEDQEELADLIMEVWKDRRLPEVTSQDLASSDLVIAGASVLADPELVGLVDSKPTLVVPDAQDSRMAVGTFVGGGGFDIGNLLASVVLP